MIVDTGASTDILDEETFNKVNQRNIVLHPTTKRLFAYGSTAQLYTLGQFDGEIGCNQRKQQVSFHVLRGNHGSLLSYKTAMALGILDLQVCQVINSTLPQKTL